MDLQTKKVKFTNVSKKHTPILYTIHKYKVILKRYEHEQDENEIVIQYNINRYV